MRAAIIGNGPSRVNYLKSDREYDLTIGCNIPNSAIYYDYTVISDPEIIWILNRSPELLNPDKGLILTNKSFETLKQIRKVDFYNIKHTFKNKDGYNSSHYACEFLILNEFDEVDIWGYDSLFNDTIDSLTDKHIPKNKNIDETMKILLQWRKTWSKITKDNPDVYFNFMYG